MDLNQTLTGHLGVVGVESENGKKLRECNYNCISGHVFAVIIRIERISRVGPTLSTWRGPLMLNGPSADSRRCLRGDEGAN
jgi:hypothetical protein